MRGTPYSTTWTYAPQGIIPAHAGNTICDRKRYSARKDHPRACGEHIEFHGGSVDAEGSSPRMRGTLPWRGAWQAGVGIIPAHAGNTACLPMTILCNGDHPRACGEHMPQLSAMSFVVGSSPRMRGTLAHRLILEQREGIIPAHAGNTSEPLRIPGRSRGSSPRMRGTPGRSRSG